MKPRTLLFLGAVLALTSCGELVSAPPPGFDPIWRVLLTTSPEVVTARAPSRDLSRMPDNTFQDYGETLRVTTSTVYAGWFATLPIDAQSDPRATAVRVTVSVRQGGVLVASNYDDAPPGFVPFQQAAQEGDDQVLYVPIDRSGGAPFIVLANGSQQGASEIEVLRIELVAPPAS